jgi:hypothetical protein
MSWFEVALHTMGSGTLTKVDGTINAAKYVEILNSCLWPGIVERKDWLVRCQNNVSEWSEMPILGLLFQWGTVRGQNYWNDNGVMVHHLDVNVSRIYRNARFIWYKQELQTLDLDIIENVWLKMKIELQKMSDTVDSRDQLYNKIFQIWTNISVDYIRNLYKQELQTL